MNIIAIDCGASFIKGAYVQEGKIIRKKEAKAPVVHGREDILEPVQINSLIPIVKQMLMELAGDDTKVKLCISNEMHGFLLAYEDGTPFTDYISWQKEFGRCVFGEKSALQILEQSQYCEDILYTGMPLRAGLPSCNLLYLILSGYLKKDVSELYFYTLGDYILAAISGEKPFCHPTNAAGTGLFDLRTNDWNKRLIQAVSGETIIFPKIENKEMCFNLGKLTVYAMPAIGDQQAALLGSGVDSQGILSFNLGTGAQVSKLVGQPICAKEYQIRPYFDGNYLKTLPHVPSGRALNVYIRFFKDFLKQCSVEMEDDKLWEVLLEAENKAEQSELKCDLSFFENAMSENTVGKISNIGEYSLVTGELMRAIFTQMAENFIRVAEIIEPDITNVKKLVFSGGVARKIETIRKQILLHYGGEIPHNVADNETLLGLYKYGTEKREK